MVKHSTWRLTSALMALLLMLSMLTACNGSGSGQEGTEGSTVGSTETEPSATATEPAATETQPQQTEPPATQPPATEPPATEPPATEPPATQPPATQPPATEPPAPVNDIGKPITKDEFTVTVTSVEQSGNQYTVNFTLTYTGTEAHALSAKERIFVINADKRKVSVTDIFDTNGSSLLGGSIASGQTMTIKAVFTLTDGFTPVEFRYVYDIMGFRYVQAAL